MNFLIMKHTILLLGIILTLSTCTNKQDFKLAPDIYILDNENPINSMDELSGKLSGKSIYIDRWATWCSPCLEEFKHSEALHKFLKDKDVEIVYLNSDGDLDEKYWFEFIVDHNLKGFHLRLDSALLADLVRKGIFIPRIPQYIIVGKNGEVFENNALKPSSGEDLFDQLNNLLDL